MSESDDDFVIDDEGDAGKIGRNGKKHSTRSKGKLATGRVKERWEDIQRSWDLVTEGADGTLSGTVEGLLEAEKRRRLMRDTTPFQRGIIRHLIIIVDLSSAMSESDFRPTRYLLVLRYVGDFVTEFFEQNPISQVSIVGLRDGLAERITPLSGNPAEHLAALQSLRTQDPRGQPSLQNGLDMARASLSHTPSHGTREIIVIYGALLSADPGDIHKTIGQLVQNQIKCAVVGLAARMAICAELCAKTNGVSNENTNFYGVALHEGHLQDMLMQYTTPPAARAAENASAPSLLQMGFPSRVDEDRPSLCACHGKESRGGYMCSRCEAKVCSLPLQCPTCDLQLIQSTHLARSYHHLFPLKNYVEVTWETAQKKGSLQCFACLSDFPPILDDDELGELRRSGKTVRQGASESSRYACTSCGEDFCIDCDVFAHSVTHNCAGCLGKPQVYHAETNGNSRDSNGASASS